MPSKSHRPTQSQRARAAAAAAAARRRRNRVIAAGVVGVLVIVAVVGAVAVFGSSNKDKDKNDTKNRNVNLTAAADAAGCQADGKGDTAATVNPARHTAPEQYQVDPPSGGNHDQVPADPAFYEDGKQPIDGKIVHSLEHGYVAIWYQPDLPADQIAALHRVFDEHGRDVLVVPRASMSAKVAATAWMSDDSHRRLLCDRVDAAVLGNFVEQYANKGPEAVPH